MRVTFILLFVLVSQSLQAQNKNIVKVNLFSPVVNSISFFYERGISPKTSLQFNAFYTKEYEVDSDQIENGWGVTAAFRIYAVDSFPKGLYVSPFCDILILI